MNKLTKIGFTGDFSFSGYFQKQYKNNDLIDDAILNFLNDNDAVVINYESPITPCRMTNKKRLAHRTDPEALDFVVEKFKNPILSFANNHMMDYRAVGMIDTIDSVNARNIPFIGGGRNRQESLQYQIIGDDVKVGVLAVQYKKLRKNGINFLGPMQEDMVKDIKWAIDELRPKVDWIVMVYHGGDEFLFAPMPYIKKVTKKFLDMGCDIIVGHHPHVVQGYEYIGNKAVFYSLGNFMFDTNYQRIQEGTDQGMLLSISFTKDSYSEEHMPIFIDRETPRIVPAEGEEPHFVNIGELNYSKLWCTEAMRKLDALERAKVLLIRDREEAAVETVERELAHKAMLVEIELKKAALAKAENEDETDLENPEADDDSIENVSDDETGADNNTGAYEDADNEPAEEGDDENKISVESGIARKKSSKESKKLKKLYKKVVVNRRKNYRTFVLRTGRLRYKLFYKNK